MCITCVPEASLTFIIIIRLVSYVSNEIFTRSFDSTLLDFNLAVHLARLPCLFLKFLLLKSASKKLEKYKHK